MYEIKGMIFLVIFTSAVRRKVWEVKGMIFLGLLTIGKRKENVWD